MDGEEIKTTNDEEPSSYQNQQVGQVYGEQMLTRVWITSRLILHNTGVILKSVCCDKGC